MILPVPVLDGEGKWNGSEIAERETTKAEYLDTILFFLEDEGSRDLPITDALEALGVCPAAFVDMPTAELVSLESDSSVYHVLPRGGGVLDEPAWLMDAFRAVRKARDDYYLWRARRGKGGK